MIVFHLWLGIETTALIIGIRNGLEIADLIKIVWDENTQAIFGAIMGFWFGNRAVRHNVDPTYAAMPVVKPAAELKG